MPSRRSRRCDRSVDVFVRKLRSKLERVSPSWSYIHTHFGIGYRFAAEPVEEPVGAGLPVPEPVAGALPAAVEPILEAAPEPEFVPAH